MMELVTEFVLFTFIFSGNYAESADINDARSLQTYLFNNYTAEHRPVYNQSERVQLSAMFDLLAITDMDDVRQEFICNGLFKVTWRDEFLVWNASDFGGINFYTFVNGYKTWFPQLTVTNTLDKRNVFEDDTQRMSVRNDGTVNWIPTAIFKTSCPLNVHLFPFDVQECEIHIMTVHYIRNEVELLTGTDVVHLTRFQKNGQWEILDTSFSIFHAEDVNKWRISIKFQRRPTFYVLNVIIPIMILSFLNMAVFAIPANSGEKLSFSVTMLLSLVVYMTFVSQLMPKTSTTGAMLTGYLTAVTAASAINVGLTIMVLNFHNRDREEPVPGCLQKLARGFCMVHKKTHGVDEISNERSDVHWGDVSKSLDYIFLRLTLTGLLMFTFGFFIAAITRSNAG